MTNAAVYSIAPTKSWRWVFTGSSDGKITKWDFFGTLNGKSMLTQIQRSGMVDSVAKVYL
jgi:transcriptional activator SPT8